jgi:hypothetical protein
VSAVASGAANTENAENTLVMTPRLNMLNFREMDGCSAKSGIKIILLLEGTAGNIAFL